MILSIHQPNFFPWYPYFEKIANSDIFVIMVNCQYEKNNYQNRFKMNEKWYTMSVLKGNDSINEKRYMTPLEDWRQIKSKLPLFGSILSRFDNCITENLAITNVKLILALCDIMKIKTKIYLDYPTTLTGTDRLIDICKTHGATKYLSGESGSKYLELDKFYNNLEILYHTNQTKKPILEVLNEIG